MKNACRTLFVVILVCGVISTEAQVGFNANTTVPVYNGHFQYGTNMGYYGPSWSDMTLANISAGNAAINQPGLNAKSLRIPLPEDFLDYWGYTIRMAEFNHYASLGMKDLTIFLQSPSNAHRDPGYYEGCNQPSNLWANLYTPIWDGGANGTPVNENNYYALYVYKTVTQYKNITKFWEIVNEPDFDGSGNGWKDPGQPGNWWENTPRACDLVNLHAPVYHYIRLLRISYEVIKSVDPEAYIALGGIGFPSFLDVLLRNSDNPADGSLTAEYPLNGGAYFDVVSYHNYPMYALRYWDNSINNFAYKRHSDAAADEYINAKKRMETVLTSRGYDNNTYPSKYFICTETNIARKEFDDYIGSDLAQTNYVMKTLVESQMNAIQQLYFFTLGESKTLAESTNPYEMMGLYQKLEGVGPLSNGGVYGQQYTNSGIGFRTTADLLHNATYDETRTLAMNIPAGIMGAAFRDANGNYIYVLWARTTQDKNESPSATYSFPSSLNIAPTLTRRDWNYSITGINTAVANVNIALNGTPVFLSESFLIVPIHDPGTVPDDPAKSFALQVYPNPASQQAFIRFTLTSPERVRIGLYDEQGRLIRQIPASSNYGTGTHIVSLQDVSRLAAGVYYCRFETDKVRLVKKMIISR